MEELTTKIEVASLLQVPIANWRTTLARECNVYICEEGYIAKRFDQIHYKFVDKQEAKEIIIDNLYALLRFKYFKILSEQTDNQIKKIVLNFVQNLQTSIQRISFLKDSQYDRKKLLPNNCIAFRNGVYDFLHNDWLFKYDIYSMDNQANRIYQYDYDYIIMWYINIDYEPNIVNIKNTLSYKLIYNMSFDNDNNFNQNKYNHLCEILGYTILQSFSDKFVCLVGNGSNGKTCLFEGILADRVIPRPSTIEHNDIENNKYITNILKNKHINLALSSDMVKDVKTLKQLTSSIYQTIETPHKPMYEGLINCKYIFALTNNKIFNDNSIGFIRRINTYRIYYKWDCNNYYLDKGNYYDVRISDSLQELKDKDNILTYIELAVYGLKLATQNFTKQFEFTYNDMDNISNNANIDFISVINNITLKQIANYIKSASSMYEKNKDAILDTCGERIYLSKYFKLLSIQTYNKFIKELDKTNSLLNNQDIYIALWVIRDIALPNVKRFTDDITNQIRNVDIKKFKQKMRYIKVRIENDRLKVK